jgi:hypothetical protein
MTTFVQEMLNLHRGQGQDILWRETCVCPTGHSLAFWFSVDHFYSSVGHRGELQSHGS